MMKKDIILSIVVPVYNEEQSIEPFIEKITLQGLQWIFHWMIFVI